MNDKREIAVDYPDYSILDKVDQREIVTLLLERMGLRIRRGTSVNEVTGNSYSQLTLEPDPEHTNG